MSRQDMAVVFVYGTLKQGFGNHRVMESAQGRYIGPAILKNAKLIHLGGFPGLVETTDPSDIVHGEMYVVNEANMGPLDGLEGYNQRTDTGMYLRRSRWVEQVDGEGFMAYTYIWNRDEDRPIIEGGCWS